MSAYLYQGTGFSYADTDYVRNEEGVTQDMYTFLQKFLSLYPQYKKSEFYITGESYVRCASWHIVTTVLISSLTGRPLCSCSWGQNRHRK
jgi:hypothetical protein